LTNIKAYITLKSSTDISSQNSYFNYFTTTEIKIKKYQEGKEKETQQK
jgi:hypothetical protein